MKRGYELAEKKKLKLSLRIIIKLVRAFFSIERYFVHFKIVNKPTQQALYAIWHGEQCVVYSVEDKENFYVLVSPSNDGEIVAQGIEVLSLKSIRGSSKRNAVAGSLQILEKLKEGASVAIMVDGPKGPKGVVKEGIVNLAKLSGVPVIPLAWVSNDKTFLKFNSWDNFRIPFGFCRTVVVYGEPIYIPSELTKEESKAWCEKIAEELNKVSDDARENCDKYWKDKSIKKLSVFEL